MANKSISVPADIKAFLDGLPNASSYVVDLINRDRGSGDANLENSIRKVLTELLSELKPPPVQSDPQWHVLESRACLELTLAADDPSDLVDPRVLAEIDRLAGREDYLTRVRMDGVMTFGQNELARRTLYYERNEPIR
ncbi:hypothetical protein ACFPVX_04695 [Cohnella faecalis]|uniref:Uncharacterized protein n=1 Tax=Cohnella faecalis TaxID=2315694 RepID=A0A398CT40_9BACL|nr:hypothetical protein [Cohnella faecalis]RIE03928.1 hypothetical protein D3H35_08160 [Cohnella faecalis]